MKRASHLIVLLGLAGTWLGFFLLAPLLASRLGARLGPKLVSLGDGQFSDAEVFLRSRLFEAAWLVTVTIVVVWAVLVVARLAAPRMGPLWKWIPGTLAGFIGLNIWLKLAAGTCLFWLLLWNGKGGTDNLTQFQIKLRSVAENLAARKAVIAGSSQARAQVDRRQLNAAFGSQLFTTGLDFPGNRAHDFLLLIRQLPREVDLVICYVSEQSFFATGTGPGFSLFFSATDVPDYRRLHGPIRSRRQDIGHALLGDVLPLFWMRGPLTERFLGSGLSNLEQVRRDAALESDLAERAKEAAAGYTLGPEADFQIAAFEAFVNRCVGRRIRVVICAGQLNPVLSQTLSPELRPRMLEVLRGCAKKYSTVTLIEPDQMPPQTAADYEDLTHVNPPARERYTAALVEQLRRVLSATEIPPTL